MKKTWVLLCSGITQICFAQTPTITHAIPVAAAPGSLTEVTFDGANLAGATTLWTSFPAKTTLVPEKTDASKATWRLTLPSNLPVGLGAVRLATTNGISPLHLFMIDDLPSVAESGKNNTVAAAQALKPPVAVDGACEELGYDYYRINARRGQRIAVDIVANRLGSSLDAVVRLLDAKGRELAYCDDDPAVFPDPRFIYKFTESGEYTLEVRDLNYQGGPQFFYRLRLGDFPLLNAPFPPAVQPGKETRLVVAGRGLDSVRSLKVKPTADAKSVPLAVKFSNGQGSGFADALVSALPERIEVEPNDLTNQATKVAVPCAVNGRFARPKDRDFWEFEARKDQRLVLRARTRSLGSPCDVFLQLQKADGSKLAQSQTGGADEGTITNTFKEAGTFRLLVEELTQQAGPDLVYRIEIEPLGPGFALSVETDQVAATNGGTFEIKVSAVRRDYDGPIDLSLEGLAGDAKLEGNSVPEKKSETTLKVTLPARFVPGHASHFRIAGKAKSGSTELSTIASTAPALRKLFPQMRYLPEEFDGLIALGITAATPEPPKPTEEKRKKKS